MWFSSITSSLVVISLPQLRSARRSSRYGFTQFGWGALIRLRVCQTDIFARGRFHILKSFEFRCRLSVFWNHFLCVLERFASVDCANVYFRGKTFSIETYKSEKAGFQLRAWLRRWWRWRCCSWYCHMYAHRVFEHLFTHRIEDAHMLPVYGNLNAATHNQGRACRYNIVGVLSCARRQRSPRATTYAKLNKNKY